MRTRITELLGIQYPIVEGIRSLGAFTGNGQGERKVARGIFFVQDVGRFGKSTAESAAHRP